MLSKIFYITHNEYNTKEVSIAKIYFVSVYFRVKHFYREKCFPATFRGNRLIIG